MPGALAPARQNSPQLNLVRQGFRSPYAAGLSAIPDNGLGDYVADAAQVGLAYATGGTSLAAGSIVTKLVSGWTSGAQIDAQRQARVNYFLQQAEQGNVAAAQLILGAPNNVSGNERDMWTQAAQILSTNPTWATTLQAAQTAGPVWLTGSGDTATNYPAMKNFTATWAAQHGGGTGVFAPGGAVGNVASFAGGVPTWLWLVGAAGAYFAFARRR